MHCPSGSSGLAIPDGYVLPFSPKGLFSPVSLTGVFSPFSPTGLFSPFSRGEWKEATKAEHTATDETPPTIIKCRYRTSPYKHSTNATSPSQGSQSAEIGRAHV